MKNWQHILAESYTRPQDLAKDLQLPQTDFAAHTLFKTRVPKPFAEKIEKGNPNDPLLLQVLPQPQEFAANEHFIADPLAEKQFNPVSGVLHKYRSRVLITLRGACAINCRYCFRRHFDYADNRIDDKQLAAIIDYIHSQPSVNEVILSGGDPLMAKDTYLATLVQQLAAIPQLKRLRIHSRLPVVIPERITHELVDILAANRLAVVFVTHCNHANEIDEHFKQHIQRLAHANITVLNQSVLLRGVNDNVDSLVALSEQLFASGILPYYLFLPDKVAGTAHFDVELNTAKQLIKTVAAELPGYLVPKLAREVPGQFSKDIWL